MTGATLRLAGVDIPRSGFGTYPLNGDECERAVLAAIEAGYRHIDTAEMYENEEAVGAAIRASGVPRGEIFVTSKIWHDNLSERRFEAAAEASLSRLGLDQVDLYLIHWPNPAVPVAAAVERLNRVLERGLARSIGISNHSPAQIDEAVAVSNAPLAVNQIEYHPYLDQTAVKTALARHGIGLTAYCPIARGKVFDDPVIQPIADRHGVSSATVALAWLLAQDNTIVIPKTSSPARMAENLAAEDLRLSADDLSAIDELALPTGRCVDPANVVAQTRHEL